MPDSATITQGSNLVKNVEILSRKRRSTTLITATITGTFTKTLTDISKEWFRKIKLNLMWLSSHGVLKSLYLIKPRDNGLMTDQYIEDNLGFIKYPIRFPECEDFRNFRGKKYKFRINS